MSSFLSLIRLSGWISWSLFVLGCTKVRPRVAWRTRIVCNFVDSLNWSRMSPQKNVRHARKSKIDMISRFCIKDDLTIKYNLLIIHWFGLCFWFCSYSDIYMLILYDWIRRQFENVDHFMRSAERASVCQRQHSCETFEQSTTSTRWNIFSGISHAICKWRADSRPNPWPKHYFRGQRRTIVWGPI